MIILCDGLEIINLEFNTPVYLLVHTLLRHHLFTHCIIIQIKEAPSTNAFTSHASTFTLFSVEDPTTCLRLHIISGNTVLLYLHFIFQEYHLSKLRFTFSLTLILSFSD